MDNLNKMTENNFKKSCSLYIHIPFCEKKCNYCDFLSFRSDEETKSKYIDVLKKEIEYWKNRLYGSYKIRTIYIGGGTPSVLSSDCLEKLGEEISKIIDVLGVTRNFEFSIEINPGTLDISKILAIKKMGVNRVSLGLQSANNNELAKLGRIHTYEKFEESYFMLRENGFNNINIDIMSDIPDQTYFSYGETLNKIVKLNPEHISSYSLIVEEGTPFYALREKGELNIPDEDTDRKMYEFTKKMLEENGYFRYEISNYSKQGRECRHNLVYWDVLEYIGLGLGASSFFGGKRFNNTVDLQTYLDDSTIVEDKFNSRFESIQVETKKSEMEEFVFLGLRKTEGISISAFNRRFGEDFRKLYEKQINKFINNKLLAENENRDRICLTEKGIDVSNMILSEFLLD